jgi:hypothetical protein
MSYVVTNFYENPGPYYGTSDKGEPVPGWGPLPVMAGGDLVGVGVMAVATADPSRPRFTVADQAVEEDIKRKKTGMPAWLLVIGAGLIGAGIGLAQNRGKLRKVGLKP